MRFASFFVLRTPLLETRREEPDDLAASLALPEVEQAIAWASPSLGEALRSDRRGRRETLLSASRYAARMRGRPTPFATLAGYTWGVVTGPETRLELAARSEYRRVVRLDLQAVQRLVDRESWAALRDIDWLARGDIVRFADTLRMSRRGEAGQSTTMFDVDRSRGVDAVLAAAQTPASFDTLVQASSAFARTAPEAESFVRSLIEHRLLVPAVTPSVFLLDETAPLRATPNLAMTAGVLSDLRDLPLAGAPDLRAQVAAVSLEPQDLIVDLAKPAKEMRLGRDVLRPLAELVGILERTEPPRVDARLQSFLDDFRHRYEGREVRLVEALDARRGVPFPSGLARSVVKDEATQSWKLSLLARSLQTGGPIRLEDEEIPAERHHQVPATAAVAFSLAGDPTSIWTPVVVGSPGTAMFARATAVLPPAFHSAVVDFLAGSAARFPDEDPCDVASFLLGKSAAFSQYPPLLPFEINLTEGRSSSVRSLDVNEIFVSATARGFRLRSRETNRALRLQLTSAAVTDRDDATPLFRFLGAVARSTTDGFAWSWGVAASLPHLPRVAYREHVLSPASWNLSTKQVATLRRARSQQERWEATQALRRQLGLPRHLRFQEGADLLLPVDLEDRWSVDGWVEVVRDRVRLSESFPAERSWVAGPEGRYQHELVVPVLGSNTASASKPRPFLDQASTFDDVLPGGDVLYLRLVGDADVLFEVLGDIVETVIRPALAGGTVRRWFFLPFSPGDTEIRLRIFGEPAVLWSPAILGAVRTLLLPRLEQRSLHALHVDTYQRETYRYGGPRGMELAERLFEQSSEIALLLHGEHEFGTDASDHTAMCAHVGSLRVILHETGLSLEAQRDVARATATRYERHKDPAVSRKLAGDLYREIRPALLAGEPATVTADQRATLRQILTEARAAESEISVGFSAWLSDCLHVHSIRLRTTWHALPHLETVAYLLLVKVLGAEISGPSAEPAAAS